METKSVKKNYIYNLLYQVFLIAVPIFLTPYVARVLGNEGTGQYSFTYSIVSYFVLAAAIGFTTYGQRLIASHQSDKKRQSIDFWEIFIARLVPSIISLFIYFVIVFCNVFEDKYKTLLIIHSLNIISVIFDLSFFFFGNEEFGKLAIRNISIKALSIAATFVFVRTQNDLWIYTLIQGASVLLSNLVLWVRLPKTLVKVKINELKPMTHFVPTLILFIPTIATSVYTSLDKTLIGLITHSDIENGNYEYAEKLVKMALTVITSLGAVFVARNSSLFQKNNTEELKSNIYKSSQFIFFIGLPLVLGCISIVNNFIPWYLGDGYDKASLLLIILSPLIVIIGFSNVFGMQYLLPTKKDKKFTISIVCGAFLNCALTIPLTFVLQSYGAAIATVVAELFITITMYLFVRKELSIKKILKKSTKYLIASLIMFGATFTLGWFLPSSIGNTLIIFGVGVVVYFILLVIFKEEFVWQILRFIKTIFDRVMKRR